MPKLKHLNVLNKSLLSLSLAAFMGLSFNAYAQDSSLVNNKESSAQVKSKDANGQKSGTPGATVVQTPLELDSKTLSEGLDEEADEQGITQGSTAESNKAVKASRASSLGVSEARADELSLGEPTKFASVAANSSSSDNEIKFDRNNRSGVLATGGLNSTEGIIKWLFSTIAILAIIFIFGYILRKSRFVQRSVGGMRLIRQMSLGPKERLVQVQVGDKQLLLGVTSQNVNLIMVLDEGNEPKQVQAKNAAQGDNAAFYEQNTNASLNEAQANTSSENDGTVSNEVEINEPRDNKGSAYNKDEFRTYFDEYARPAHRRDYYEDDGYERYARERQPRYACRPQDDFDNDDYEGSYERSERRFEREERRGYYVRATSRARAARRMQGKSADAYMMPDDGVLLERSRRAKADLRRAESFDDDDFECYSHKVHEPRIEDVDYDGALAQAKAVEQAKLRGVSATDDDDGSQDERMPGEESFCAPIDERDDEVMPGLNTFVADDEQGQSKDKRIEPSLEFDSLDKELAQSKQEPNNGEFAQVFAKAYDQAKNDVNPQLLAAAQDLREQLLKEREHSKRRQLKRRAQDESAAYGQRKLKNARSRKRSTHIQCFKQHRIIEFTLRFLYLNKSSMSLFKYSHDN